MSRPLFFEITPGVAAESDIRNVFIRRSFIDAEGRTCFRLYSARISRKMRPPLPNPVVMIKAPDMRPRCIRYIYSKNPPAQWIWEDVPGYPYFVDPWFGTGASPEQVEAWNRHMSHVLPMYLLQTIDYNLVPVVGSHDWPNIVRYWFEHHQNTVKEKLGSAWMSWVICFFLDHLSDIDVLHEVEPYRHWLVTKAGLGGRRYLELMKQEPHHV